MSLLWLRCSADCLKTAVLKCFFDRTPGMLQKKQIEKPEANWGKHEQNSSKWEKNFFFSRYFMIAFFLSLFNCTLLNCIELYCIEWLLHNKCLRVGILDQTLTLSFSAFIRLTLKNSVSDHLLGEPWSWQWLRARSLPGSPRSICKSSQDTDSKQCKLYWAT